jgi:primosomal protein N' (replication factor Y)
VVCTSERPGAATAAASAVAERIDAAGAAVLGPAPLFRLRGRERAQVVVKSADAAAAVQSVGGAVEAAAADRAHRDATFSVDVDPQ